MQWTLYEETASKLCALERARKERMQRGHTIKMFLKQEGQMRDEQAEEVLCVCMYACMYVYGRVA